MTKIISVKSHFERDPQKYYYDLPLAERLVRYVELVNDAYDRRQEALKPFSEKEQFWPKQMRLNNEELSDELRGIVPKFRGKVVGRLWYPSFALHYIIAPEDLAALVQDPVFGVVTGKVVGTSDNLLSPRCQQLAGYVILQAKQVIPEKDEFIARHEGYHVTYFHMPNGVRREQSHVRLDRARYYSLEKRAELLIDLDKSILLDEAGACIDAIDSLKDRRREAFQNDFVTEVKNTSRTMLGFQLDAIRRSGRISKDTVEKINRYEQATMQFPILLKKIIENLSHRLTNPEGLDPLGYAMSYVSEALQILDFEEIPTSLEDFCVNVLEPDRLGGPSFAAALAAALRGKNDSTIQVTDNEIS